MNVNGVKPILGREGVTIVGRVKNKPAIKVLTIVMNLFLSIHVKNVGLGVVN